jgi:hypothetical protein
VYFSEVIDKQSVSSVIVRGLCDVWSKINSATFVTEEQNVFSLCRAEVQANLVAVRIRCVSVCCIRNLTCILRVLYLQMSSWTCMSKMQSCVAKDSWKVVDVSQVMISNTITCKIHTSRLTTHVWNELSCSCSCTEILSLMSMKLELLSPLLSDSPFLSTKSFFVFPIFDVDNAKSRPTFAMFFEGEIQ